ncbi:dual specificity mitogen-activated protein kinase kinase 1-like isoform X1 [Convolutriloba macropyga]|uniref:dual specificity mitogen-activated protein kinase kinase 1-like isoform X1 n=1 Tax=Convolutriloba macropyga TaxID=536237 RepID=UPI003F5232AE
MEYVSHGSLDEKLENLPKNGSLPEEFVLKLAVDISNALVHLHFDHLLVHRDIKPPNILLQAATENRSNSTRLNTSNEQLEEENKDSCLLYNFKLCDFGNARYINDQTDYIFTRTYAAPELIKRRPHNSGACDVYSLGLVLLQCSVGLKPAAKSHSGALVTSTRSLASLLSSAEPRMRQLIRPCLKENPDQRV